MVMSLKGNNDDIFVILVTHSFKNISPYGSATFKVTSTIKLFFAIKHSFCYQKKKLMFCSKINLFKDKSLFFTKCTNFKVFENNHTHYWSKLHFG